MKKVLILLSVIAVVLLISSFDDSKKVPIAKRTIYEVVDEINAILPDTGKVPLTPKLESLFYEVYQLNYESMNGPNAVDYSMLFKWCWECRCQNCSFSYKQLYCSFFHSCSPVCINCACGAMEPPCITPYVGECSLCPS